jgi:predicted ribosome quality control (RQC) complex YloA/Tae2 family protein
MKTTHKSKYFYGNKISDYGLENKRLDYRTLAKSFDAVLVNDITKLFYNVINGEYIEPIQENGTIDNTDKIEELEEQKDELLDLYREEENEEKANAIMQQIDEIDEKIEELREEEENSYNQDIYQWYIIPYYAAEIIKEYTDDPLYYIEFLDVYVWGVTHWGTSWDYVLTDVILELDEEENEE